MDHGYGHTSDEVIAVAAACARPRLLGEYHEATYAQTVKLVPRSATPTSTGWSTGGGRRR